MDICRMQKESSNGHPEKNNEENALHMQYIKKTNKQKIGVWV
jgi:hypothetical protein